MTCPPGSTISHKRQDGAVDCESGVAVADASMRQPQQLVPAMLRKPMWAIPEC